MSLIKNTHFSFGAIYFFGHAANATFALDFVFYSQRIGFSNSEIGLIFACKILIGILFQPLFGIVCDYLRSPKRMLLVMALAALSLSAGIPLAPNRLILLIIDFSYTFAACAFMPLVDNWVVSECADEKEFNFGKLRLWGSIGFALMAFVYGRITMYVDVANMYYGRAILLTATAIFIYLYHQEKAHTRKEKKEKPDIKGLLVKKEYWLFFAFLFIFCFPLNAAGSFLPRLLLDRNLTNQYIALFLSINAIVEIPFFLYVRKLTHRAGSRGLLLIGGLFVIVRLLGLTFAGSVPLLLVANMCTAPYISLFMPGLIFYSRSISPPNTSAFALTSFQGLAIGLAGTLGTLIAGVIIDLHGIRNMYLYSSILCIMGITLFIMTSFWLKKSSR